jgi:hypothetical protein
MNWALLPEMETAMSEILNQYFIRLDGARKPLQTGRVNEVLPSGGLLVTVFTRGSQAGTHSEVLHREDLKETLFYLSESAWRAAYARLLG